MKIAIVGAGISGLSCAHYLHRGHQVDVFEKAHRIGGHTATVDVALGGRRHAVDTGFIVYNDCTYPRFTALLESLGVPGRPTRMSFSVSDERAGLEYAGSRLDTLFAQRRNILSPGFLGMVRDILRFNRRAVRDLDEGRVAPDATLGDYLDRAGYGGRFVRHYLAPMGSAIWSSDSAVVLDFPLRFFLRFFDNHGLLRLRDRPRWYVIPGGSRSYLAPLCAGFRDRIHCNSRITGVRRAADGVTLDFADGPARVYDRVVFACHSDEALALLSDPSPAEQEILGAIPYQPNEVILHTDTTLLPRLRKTWSSWNYRIIPGRRQPVVTYNMNLLQGIDAPETFCVTLNHGDAVNPAKIIGRFSYHHPVFSVAATAAQARWAEINGGRTLYCGAYWRHGFHEDGVHGALRVVDAIAQSTHNQSMHNQATDNHSTNNVVPLRGAA